MELDIAYFLFYYPVVEVIGTINRLHLSYSDIFLRNINLYNILQLNAKSLYSYNINNSNIIMTGTDYNMKVKPS